MRYHISEKMSSIAPLYYYFFSYFSEMWICGFIPDQMFYPTRLDSDLSLSCGLCAGSVHTLVDDEAYCLQTVDTYFPF